MPVALAEPPARNRRAVDCAEFEHPQLFHQAWNRRTRLGDLFRAWVDDLRWQYGRRLARTVCLHSFVKVICKWKSRGFCFAARRTPRLWCGSWRLRHAHFEIRGARDSHSSVPAGVCGARGPSPLDHGGRNRSVHGPIFGIWYDRGWFLPLTGVSQHLGNVSLVFACYWLVADKGLFGAILAMLIAAIVQL